MRLWDYLYPIAKFLSNLIMSNQWVVTAQDRGNGHGDAGTGMMRLSYRQISIQTMRYPLNPRERGFFTPL